VEQIHTKDFQDQAASYWKELSKTPKSHEVLAQACQIILDQTGVQIGFSFSGS